MKYSANLSHAFCNSSYVNRLTHTCCSIDVKFWNLVISARIRQAKHLCHLHRLTTLAFADSNYGASPLSMQCNYKTYVLFHLPHLRSLDTCLIEQDAVQNAKVHKLTSVGTMLQSNEYPPSPTDSFRIQNFVAFNVISKKLIW